MSIEQPNNEKQLTKYKPKTGNGISLFDKCVVARQRLAVIFLLGFFILSFPSCRDKEEKLNITVQRYDKLLNEYVEYNSFSALQKMNTEHLQATKFLIEDILRIGAVNDDNINGKLKAYFSDTTLRVIMNDAITKYDDFTELENSLSEAFTRLKKEIPTMKVPCIYSQISALNESVVVGDSIIGFSIDKYMGEDYQPYKRFYYPYQRRSMKPERIAPDCITFYLMSEYPFPLEGANDMKDVILHLGKIHYVTSKMLNYPSFEKELDYEPMEEIWCKANKKGIWNYMIANKHLTATDPMIIRHYTKPAPFTSFFGEDSPHMVGTWMGMQVIDAYMKQNKKVTIKQLLETTDYQQLLNDSKFKI